MPILQQFYRPSPSSLLALRTSISVPPLSNCFIPLHPTPLFLLLLAFIPFFLLLFSHLSSSSPCPPPSSTCSLQPFPLPLSKVVNCEFIFWKFAISKTDLKHHSNLCSLSVGKKLSACAEVKKV